MGSARRSSSYQAPRLTMRARTVTALLLGAACTVSIGHAADPIAGWHSFGPAIYLIHGGTLADRQVPSQKDRKLSIVIDGQPAREIFDSIARTFQRPAVGRKGTGRGTSKAFIVPTQQKTRRPRKAPIAAGSASTCVPERALGWSAADRVRQQLGWSGPNTAGSAKLCTMSRPECI